MRESEYSNKVSRNNSKRILHFRNIYAFIATVADRVINRNTEDHHQIAAYVLVRKILEMIDDLLKATEGGECTLEGIE